MEYIRGVWYAAAWSDEVKSAAIVPRRLVEEPIVLFRKTDGQIAALLDRCPHRFAPLHLGTLIEDSIQCGYHGLVFNSSGQCVLNPRGQIPKAAIVRSFPVHERDGIIWLWVGKADTADTALIPDFGFLTEAKASSKIQGYIPTGGYYELCNDNIMDLSHIDYLHPTSLGGGSIGGVTPEIKQEGSNVHIRWTSRSQKAAPVYDHFLPKPGMHVDQVIEVYWQPAATMLLVNTMTPVGFGPERALVSKNIHLITPETAKSSHYFYAGTRNFAVDDVEVNQARGAAIRAAFENEDKPIIEAVQKSMEEETDILKLRPVLLAGDGGAMRARRILQMMRDREGAPPGAEELVADRSD